MIKLEASILNEIPDFEKMHQCENGLRDLFYTAVFKKGEKLLYLMYITVNKRIYMSYGADPYLPAWTGEEVFEHVPKLHSHEGEFYTPQDYGDGDRGGMKFITCAYDKEYMEVDIFTLLHHGWNTRDFFTDFCTVKTTLVTCLAAQGCKLPAPKEKENAYMKEHSEEWFSWEDGTKVLTFPYEVGTYETR